MGSYDGILVRDIIDIHWRQDRLPVIVDTTYGGGRFWPLELHNKVVKCDLDPERAKTVRSSFTCLPFKNNSVDIIAYDPPHIPDVGSVRPKLMSEQYTIVWGADDITSIGEAFVSEAKRVLRLDGFIICKISDQIQSGKRRWQMYDFMKTCFAQGLTPCDIIIKVRKAAMPQPHEYQLHARQRHSYFLVIKKGSC